MDLYSNMTSSVCLAKINNFAMFSGATKALLNTSYENQNGCHEHADLDL